MSSTHHHPAATAVLGEISRMVAEILETEGLGEMTTITRDTRLLNDLAMESVDLVALGFQLQAHYGEAVNLAEFLAGFDLDSIIDLRAGQLADYVAGCLSGTGSEGW